MASISSDVASGGGGGGSGSGGGKLEGDGTSMAVVDDVPLLVRVLAGNPVTSAAILACLNTVDTSRLLRLYPAVAGVVAGVPWCDMDTKVTDVVRWRAAFPAAAGARVSREPVGGCLAAPALAALAGVTHLNLQNCEFVTDELLVHLPASLRTLNVRDCRSLTTSASFTHLTALTALNCSGTPVIERGVAGLPPLLQTVDVGFSSLPPGVSLAGLTRLQVLHAVDTTLDAVTLASLPPSLLELYCDELAPGASFAHLHALHTLDVSLTDIGDASLATLPPSLASLNASVCRSLTTAAMLPPLPALRLLDVSGTRVGDALVASLPAGLTELRLIGCRDVTAGVTLDHVPALQTLYSYSTDLAPGVLAGCRTRGCVVPAAGVLRGHRRHVQSLEVLTDGRLASGDETGEVRVWDVTAGEGEAGMVLTAGSGVTALAALRDGPCLAAGAKGSVEIWDLGAVPPMRKRVVACSGGSVQALAVLCDDRLAAGCGDGVLRIIDVDAGAVVATLGGLVDKVMALAVLPDGMLASGSVGGTVRLWDVGTWACIAKLAGHGGSIRTLAVLADGRLTSGSEDGAVRLWDVGTRTCVGVLTGHTHRVTSMAALPDGRLASGSSDRSVRVWDTRPAVAAAGSHAAGTVPVVAFPHGLSHRYVLVPLPDGRLACAGRPEGTIQLLHLLPPV